MAEDKMRGTNWTAKEKKFFLERYSQYRDVLEGKYSSTLTADDRIKKWEEKQINPQINPLHIS